MVRARCANPANVIWFCFIFDAAADDGDVSETAYSEDAGGSRGRGNGTRSRSRGRGRGGRGGAGRGGPTTRSSASAGEGESSSDVAGEDDQAVLGSEAGDEDDEEDEEDEHLYSFEQAGAAPIIDPTPQPQHILDGYDVGPLCFALYQSARYHFCA